MSDQLIERHSYTMQMDSTLYSTALLLPVTLVKIDKTICLQFPSVVKSMSGGSADDVIVTNASYLLPATFRPADGINQMLNGSNNGSITQVTVSITTGGQVSFGKGIASNVNFTFNGASNTDIYGAAITYLAT